MKSFVYISMLVEKMEGVGKDESDTYTHLFNRKIPHAISPLSFIQYEYLNKHKEKSEKR